MFRFLTFENLYFKNDSLLNKHLTLIKVFLGGFVIFHNFFYSVNHPGLTLILVIYYSYLSINYGYELFLEKKIKNIKFHLTLFLFFLFLSVQYRIIGSIDLFFVTMYFTQGWIVCYSFFLEIVDHKCPKKPKVEVTINSKKINSFFEIELIKNFVIIFLKFYNGIILLTYFIVSLLAFCLPLGIHLLVITSGVFLFIEKLFIFFNSRSTIFSEIYFNSRICCTNKEHLVYPVLRFLLAWEGINYSKDGLWLTAMHYETDPEKVLHYKDMYIESKNAQSTTPVRYAFEAAENIFKTSSYTDYENFKKKD